MPTPTKKPARTAAAPPPAAPPVDVTTTAAPPAGDTVTVTDETLDATPPKLLVFLRGVGTRPEIRLALGAFGYDPEEHQRGWALLHACSGYEPNAVGVVVDQKVTSAINTLDARDEQVLAVVGASLVHRAPKVHSVLLQGLAAGRGAASVVFFHTLLGRLDQLAAGTLDGVTKAEAKAADAILAKRGYHAEWRAAHAKLVAEAQSYAPLVADDGGRREAYLGHLRAARAFYEEWSRIARAEIKRKDYLMLLGLASRAPRKAPAPVTPPTT